MGKYEVTQAQWEAVMGNNPADFKGVNHPVENVSWDECVEFCQKLSQKTGLSFTSGCRVKRNGSMPVAPGRPRPSTLEKPSPVS
jgi:formylglycine-generating enzyme required for sulfatase activity